MKKKLFIKNSFLLSGSSITAGLLGYGFHILIGRSLSVSEYAVFSAVIALSVILVSPVNGIILIITRKISIIAVSSSFIEILKVYKRIIKNLVLISIFIFILGYIFFQPIYSYINFESVNQYYLTMLIAFVNAVAMINLSIIHGLQQFKSFSALTILFPLLKIIFALALLLLGLRLNGALLGVLVASFLICIIGYILIVSTSIKSDYSDYQTEKTNYIPVFIASICLIALTQMDVVIVKKLFNSNEAGLFAAVATLGKSLLYVSGGVITVAYPIIARMHAVNQSSRDLLIISFFLISMTCIVGVLFFKFFGEFVVTTLFGISYKEGGDLLWQYALAITPMALVILFENYLIAKGSVIFAWIFILALPIEIFVIYLYGSTLFNFIIIIGLCNLIILLAGLFALLIRKDRI